MRLISWRVKVFKFYCASLLIAIFFVNSFSDGGRNTEQVCFNSDGEIVFYAKGFEPEDPPLILLTDGVYKNTINSNTIKCNCRYSWGTRKPKGRKYWEANKA